jgi:hypothetical protein
MNMIKSLIMAVFVFFSAMFAFANTANAVTVRVVESGTVGLTDAGYFAGIVTLDIDGVQYHAMMTDVFYSVLTNPGWQTDYTFTWETNLYTYSDIVGGAITMYTPEGYSNASWFLLNGMLGYDPADPLWTASFNEMGWDILSGVGAWDYSSRGYPDPDSVDTLLDVYDMAVATELDPTANYSDYMFILEGGLNGGPNMLVFSSAVPIPSALWLFGSGLIGLVTIARTRKKQK